MSKYSIDISPAEQNTVIVAAIGSFKLVSAAAKEGLAAIEGQDGEFLAEIIERDAGEREVVRVKATADIVKLVVNKRLKDEKAQNAPAAATGQADTTPTEDNPQGEPVL